MSNFEDYYEILGVSPKATPEEIKRAYRDKCFILHPDRMAGAPDSARKRAEEELKRVNQAYEVLKDLGRRQQYDAQRSSRTARPQQSSLPKPKPTLDQPYIRFDDVEPGEIKKASFVIRNAGGPYNNIWFDSVDSWIRVVSWASLTSSDTLPLEVQIEAEGGEWGKAYSGAVTVGLDNEETQVKIELQTKREPARQKAGVGAGPSASPSYTPPAPPPTKSIGRGMPAWGKWFVSLALLGLIVGLIGQSWPSGSPPKAASTPPAAASTFRLDVPAAVQDGDLFPDRSRIVLSTEVDTKRWGKKYRLFIMHPDGTDKTEVDVDWASLNIDSEDHTAPLVSPDSQRIAFVVDRHDHPAAIYVMSADGTSIHRVAGWYSSIAFAWSSDKTIVYWGSGYSFKGFNFDLLYSSKYGKSYVVDTYSGNCQQLKSPPEELLTGKFVCLSIPSYGGDVIVDLLGHY